jgi:hypothetical protein
MKCTMCEETVRKLPFLLIDKTPEHKGHTQKICKVCKTALVGPRIIQKSVTLENYPFEIKCLV